MAKAKKSCENCGNFGQYYHRGICCFYKMEKGSCSILHQDVATNGFCERWRNTFTIKSLREKDVLRALRTSMENIAIIKQILEEEEEECATHPHHTQV